jgi:adenylate cyclase
MMQATRVSSSLLTARIAVEGFNLSDRLSDAARAVENGGHDSTRRRRLVIMVLGMAAEPRWSAPGDRRLEMRWRELRATLLDAQIGGHLGQIAQSLPAGLVAEFTNPINAVRCAIELHRDVVAANAKAMDLPQLELRIGVHLWESRAPGSPTYEDGVRVAGSLQDAAEAGEIVVSAGICEHVAGAPDIAVEPIRRPRLAAIGGGAFRLAPRHFELQPPRRAAPKPSLAVLPFDGSANAEGDYFAEGIVDDIVGALSAISDLLVISRSSTAHLRGAVDVRAAGRQLGVRYVVTGTTARTANRLILVPELIDTETGTSVWRKRYDVAHREIFGLQQSIALRIARSLHPKLSKVQQQRLQTRHPESLDAYDLVLQAKHRMYSLDPADFASARELLQRAVALEPGYAAAYTYMAMWHKLNLGQRYSGDETSGTMDLMRAAESALERDPADAHALALLGHCKAWLHRDYVTALDLFEQAFAAAPNSAFVWGWSSPVCSYLGDGATAVARAKYALRLCPLGPEAYFFRTALGLADYTSGNYDEAIRWGRRAMAINPRYEANLRFLAASLAARGQLAEAREIGRALLALRPDFSVARLAARYAYKDHARKAAYAAHLRAAGLPD